jgi:hypothetical protein
MATMPMLMTVGQVEVDLDNGILYSIDANKLY